ncbi:MAG: response regulator [Deltaproteobacteria bacterium]|nr:response regulator [Deltaproteobacteria bacterium]
MISSSDIFHGKILIVDDEEPNVLLIERMLRGAGYTSIASTMDPHKVSELYRNNRYDLILLDLLMPGMDGFQVMEGLKEIEPDGYLPVLVITAEPGHKLRALQAGAKDFVSKPFELAEVLARVHNMLEARLLQKEMADHEEDNPALSNIIQRNIRKIIQVRLKAVREQSFQDRIVTVMTSFFGSMPFLYMHIVWFGVWILLNAGLVGMPPFDPFPYGILLMLVSLEVILLTTLVLISQNLLGREAARLTDLGLHTGLLTEHELTRVLQMLHAIQNKIGITNDDASNLADADLEKETKLEDVLSEIERLQLREKSVPGQG